MRWSDIEFSPSLRTLRQFAGIWLAAFLALGAQQGLLRHRPVLGLVLAVLAVTVGTMGLVRPQAVRLIYVTWMVLAFPIGATVSRVLFALIFYGVFTPLGLALRLAGRDPLMLKYDPNRETYWLPKATATEPRRYFRQY